MASKSQSSRARQQRQVERRAPQPQHQPIVPAATDAAVLAGSAELSAPATNAPAKRATATGDTRLSGVDRSSPLTLLAILGIGLLIRLALLPVGQMSGDVSQFRLAATQLLNEPITSYYDAGPIGFLPGQLLLLWFGATVFDLFGGSVSGGGFVVLLKLLPAIADIAIAGMIFAIVRRFRGEMLALAATLLVVLNPAIWFVGSVWAQWDSIGAAFALLGLFLYLRGKSAYALAPVVFGALISLHIAVIALVIIAGFVLRQIVPHSRFAERFRYAPMIFDDDSERPVTTRPPEPLDRSMIAGGISLLAALAVLLIVPGMFGVGVPGISDRSLAGLLREQSDLYPYTTLNAFTLWGWLSANWQLDREWFVFGLSYRVWGWTLTTLAVGGIIGALAYVWRRLGDQAVIWAAFAASFAMFMLPTRGHERWLLPTVVLVALLAGIAPRLIWLYAVISGIYLIDVFWVFSQYEDPPTIGLFESTTLITPMSVITTLTFALGLGLALPMMLRGGSLTLPAWVPGSSRIAPPATGSAGPAGSPTQRLSSDAPANVRLDTARAELASVARPAWQVWYLPLGIALLGLVLYIVRLDTPDDYVYDEVYYPFTSAELVDGNRNTFDPFANPDADVVNGDATFYQGEGRNRECTLDDCVFHYEWTHPPLGKEFIAAGIWIFGDNPFGWRIISTIAGALGLFIVYRLTLALTGRWLAGALAAGFLLVDGLYFVQARTSMLDVFIIIFTTASLWAFLRYLRLPIGAPARDVYTTLLVTGVIMGLALSVKWNSVYSGGLIGLVAVARLGWVWWKSGQNARKPRREFVADFRNNLVAIPLCLIVVPLAVYFTSYIHMFALGFDMSDWTELQRQMWVYHSSLDATHKYASVWWEWPLALMPVWYGTQPGDDGTTGYLFANVNPVLAWGMVPAVSIVCWLWWKERAVRWAPLLILAIGFFGQWLPWMLSPRMSFVYHFLPAVIFGAIGVATAVDIAWRQRSLEWRIPAVVYSVTVVLVFLFLFPIYSAMPLTPEGLDMRTWFEGWTIR